jgi:hypothetical protein
LSSIITPLTYSIAESSLYGVLSLIIAVVLLGLLIYKESLLFSRRPSLVLSRRALNVVIAPLLIAFSMMALVSLTNVRF